MKCAVPNCHKNVKPFHRYPVHRIPLFQEWKKRIQCPRLKSLDDKKIYSVLRVCDAHFSRWNRDGSRKLMYGSVPTIDVPGFSGEPTKENSFVYLHRPGFDGPPTRESAFFYPEYINPPKEFVKDNSEQKNNDKEYTITVHHENLGKTNESEQEKNHEKKQIDVTSEVSVGEHTIPDPIKDVGKTNTKTVTQNKIQNIKTTAKGKKLSKHQDRYQRNRLDQHKDKANAEPETDAEYFNSANDGDANIIIANSRVSERVTKTKLENVVVNNTASLEELEKLAEGNTDRLKLKKVVLKCTDIPQRLKKLLELEPARAGNLKRNIDAIKGAQREIGILDVLVCGQCHLAFHFMEEFKQHKEAVRCAGETPIENSTDSTDYIWACLLWKNSLKKITTGNYSTWQICMLWQDMTEELRTPWIVAGRKILNNLKISQFDGVEEPVTIKSEPGVGNKAFMKLSNYVAKTLQKKSLIRNRYVGLQSFVPAEYRHAKKSCKKPGKTEERVVEKILAKRMNPDNKQYEYLVKWEGLSQEDNTLEPRSNLTGCIRLVDIFETQLATEKELRALKVKHLANQYNTRMHQSYRTKSQGKRSACNEEDEMPFKKKKKKRPLPPTDSQAMESTEPVSTVQPHVKKLTKIDPKKVNFSQGIFVMSAITSPSQLTPGANIDQKVLSKQHVMATKVKLKKGAMPGPQLQRMAMSRLPLNQITGELKKNQTVPTALVARYKNKKKASNMKNVTKQNDRDMLKKTTSTTKSASSKLEKLVESLNMSEDLEMETAIEMETAMEMETADEIASDDDYVTDPFPEDLPPIPPPSPERELTLCPLTGKNLDGEKPRLRPRSFKNIIGSLGERKILPLMPLLINEGPNAPGDKPTNESIMVQGVDGEIYQVVGKNDEGKTAKEIIGVDGVEGGEILPVGTEQLAQLIPILPPSEEELEEISSVPAPSEIPIPPSTEEGAEEIDLMPAPSEIPIPPPSEEEIIEISSVPAPSQISGEVEIITEASQQEVQDVSIQSEGRKDIAVTVTPQQVMKPVTKGKEMAVTVTPQLVMKPVAKGKEKAVTVTPQLVMKPVAKGKEMAVTVISQQVMKPVTKRKEMAFTVTPHMIIKPVTRRKEMAAVTPHMIIKPVTRRKEMAAVTPHMIIKPVTRRKEIADTVTPQQVKKFVMERKEVAVTITHQQLEKLVTKRKEMAVTVTPQKVKKPVTTGSVIDIEKQIPQNVLISKVCLANTTNTSRQRVLTLPENVKKELVDAVQRAMQLSPNNRKKILLKVPKPVMQLTPAGTKVNTTSQEVMKLISPKTVQKVLANAIQHLIPAGSGKTNAPQLEIRSVKTVKKLVKEVPTGSVGEKVPTKSAGEEVPTESAGEEVPTESVSEEVPTESVSEEVPTESVSEEVPTESVSEEVPTESAGEEVPTESVSEEVPTESAGEEVPTESVSEEVPTESVGEEVPTESVGEKLLFENVCEEVHTENVKETVSVSSEQAPSQTNEEDESSMIAQIVSAGPPSPGGTRVLKLLLPDGTHTTTQIDHEQYLSIMSEP